MATQRMKWERKMGRQARRLGQDEPGSMMPGSAGALPPESPSPRAVEKMAAGGVDLVRGNSDQVPMTPEGHAQITDVGRSLAAQGGPTQIVASTAKRTLESAQDVAAQNPGAPISTDPGLESHALGIAEGSPRTPKMQKLLTDLIRKHPDARIPGQGAMTKKPSESFNEYRTRALASVKGLMQKLADNPQERILAPTSTTVVKLVYAWIANGHPDDGSVSHAEMLTDLPTGPGTLYRMSPKPSGDWEIKPFDPKKEVFTPGAIYFLLHGMTPSNALPADQVDARQKARAEIVKAVVERNWRGVQEAAKRGATAGLPDAEIEAAIDDGLPSAQGAADLPSPDLLAAHSIASDRKRAELLPAVQQRFAGLDSMPPDAAHALRSHLGRIGAL